MRDVGMVRANHSVYVATRKLVGIVFFPPPCGSQGCQDGQQAFLLTETSCCPPFIASASVQPKY